MMNKNAKRYIVLGVLFFLPVAFLLMLYPSKHNYIPLDIINEQVLDLNGFTSDSDETIILQDHITVLGFIGKQPLDNSIAALNLKELVYDKFKGFKKFQIVIVAPNGTQKEVEELKKEVNTYEDLKFWYYVFGSPEQINMLYNNLETKTNLKSDLSTDHVFIIDKDLNQRGRIDDREDKEIVKKVEEYGLSSYDCIEVSEIKNKMSDDMRILFTEYREKRKGIFEYEIRRAKGFKTKS
jgi:hypothetical protein